MVGSCFLCGCWWGLSFSRGAFPGNFILHCVKIKVSEPWEVSRRKATVVLVLKRSFQRKTKEWLFVNVCNGFKVSEEAEQVFWKHNKLGLNVYMLLICNTKEGRHKTIEKTLKKSNKTPDPGSGFAAVQVISHAFGLPNKYMQVSLHAAACGANSMFWPEIEIKLLQNKFSDLAPREPSSYTSQFVFYQLIWTWNNTPAPAQAIAFHNRCFLVTTRTRAGWQCSEAICGPNLGVLIARSVATPMHNFIIPWNFIGMCKHSECQHGRWVVSTAQSLPVQGSHCWYWGTDY